MDIICYIVVLAIAIFAIVSFIKAIKRAMHRIKYESNPNTTVTYSGYYADKHDQYIDDWQLLINIAFIKDAIDYFKRNPDVFLKIEESIGVYRPSFYDGGVWLENTGELVTIGG